MRLASDSFTFVTASVALVFALFLPLPAAGQEQASFQAVLSMSLAQDLDGSGSATCGDIVHTRVVLTPTSLLTARDVVLDVPLDPKSVLRPVTVTASHPHGTWQVLDGTTITDTHVTIRFGDVCPIPECPGNTLVAEFDVTLAHTAGFLEVQGEATGANFPPTLTDAPPVGGTADPTLFPFSCSGSGGGGGGEIVFRGTVTDALVEDLDGDGLADAGDTVRYTARLTNTGTLTAPDTIYTAVPDPASTLIPGSVTTTQGSVAVGNSAGDAQVTVAIGTLTGSTVRIEYSVRIVAPVPAGVSQLAHQGEARRLGILLGMTDDPDLPGSSDPTVTPLDFDPDLALTKGDGGISVTTGELLPYTLTVSNLSARQGAAGVVLSETVPTYTTFAAGASSPGWSCVAGAPAGSACELTLGAVGPGVSISRTFAVRVDPTLPAGVTAIANSARVDDDGQAGPDPAPANNQASDSTPLVDLAPSLTLDKVPIAQTTPLAPGGLVGWELRYANTGNQDAEDAVLSEEIPTHTTFFATASAPGWICPPPGAGSTCVFLLGEVAAGDSGAIPFVVRIAEPLPAGVETIDNCATLQDGVTGGPGPKVLLEACSSVPVPGAVPDLRIAKSDGGADVGPGGTVDYQLTVTHQGSQDATGVEIRETVPDHTAFSPGDSSPGWTCSAGGGPGAECVFPVGALGAGASVRVTFAVVVASTFLAPASQIVNTALVGDDGTNGADPTPADNQASDSTPLVGVAPNLALTKSDGGVEVEPGGVVVYELVATNQGAGVAGGVVIRELVPPHTHFAAGSSTAGWSCPGGSGPGTECLLDLATLAPGDHRMVRFALRVDDPVPDGVTQIRNAALLSDNGAGGTDPEPDNNFASDTTPLILPTPPPPRLQLLFWKRDLVSDDLIPDQAANPGEEVTYVITLRNDSDLPALDLALHSPVDPATELVQGSVETSLGRVVLGNNPGETYVQVEIDRLEPGEGVAISFRVVIADPFPEGPRQILCQAQLTGSNFNLRISDDPDTFEPLDPTRTPVVVPGDGRGIVDIPTLTIWGVLLLVGLLALVGTVALRRPVSATGRPDLS